jgi:alpha-1,2-mannosyltransferase
MRIRRIASSPGISSSPRSSDRLSLRSLAAIGLLAFVVRLVPVLIGGGLLGIHGYDDGVYMGSAIALLHGVIPYRDFLLLHPPGIVFSLVPFAAVGVIVGDPTAFAIARVVTMAIGSFSAILVALIAGRHSHISGLTAGVLYAVWTTASNAERSTDLHAVQNAVVLAGLLVLIQPGRIDARRAAAAGLALGLAVGIQLWQGLTLVVLLWWIFVRSRRSDQPRLLPVGAYLGAAALGFGIICLPLFVAAAEPMVRELVLVQMGRPNIGIVTIERLRVIEGFPRQAQLPAAFRVLVADPLVIGLAIAAATALVITAWRYVWTRPWAVLAVTATAVILLTPSFFNDYPSLVAPAGCLVGGTALAAAASAAVDHGIGRAWVRAGLIAMLTSLGLVSVARTEGDPLDIAAVEADLARARCVAADSPSVLVLTRTFRRNLVRGCPVVLDPSGIAYDQRYGRGHDPRAATWRLDVPGYQAEMVNWYGSADAALFVRLPQDGLTDATTAEIKRRLPVQRRHGIVLVRLAE